MANGLDVNKFVDYAKLVSEGKLDGETIQLWLKILNDQNHMFDERFLNEKLNNEWSIVTATDIKDAIKLCEPVAS